MAKRQSKQPTLQESAAEVWFDKTVGLEERYLCIVRIADSKELVGFFYADSVFELCDLIDHECDPSGMEYRIIENGGGFYYGVGAPAVGVDLDHEDEAQGEVNQDAFWNRLHAVGAEPIDPWIDELHNEDGWIPLVDGSTEQPEPAAPYEPKFDAAGDLLPETRILPRDLPEREQSVDERIAGLVAEMEKATTNIAVNHNGLQSERLAEFATTLERLVDVYMGAVVMLAHKRQMEVKEMFARPRKRASKRTHKVDTEISGNGSDKSEVVEGASKWALTDLQK